jgi:ATP-dependent Lon protease
VHLDHLPLFPLPLVLFPGMTLPLHIFEQRYRRMLADVLAGDGRFGLIVVAEGTQEDEIAPGTIGTIAEVTSSEKLPDGRSNIVVRGVERFSFSGLVDTALPYRLARGETFEDEPEFGPEVHDLADRVRQLFQRVGKAARTLTDDPAPVPELPDDPSLLSFAIAAIIDLDLEARQQILASRSSLDRLQRLDSVLSPALDPLVRHAAIHTVAKTNGRGTHVQP